MALGDLNKPKKAPVKKVPINQASNYEAVRDRISKERGISPKALDNMLNKIGYHESARTMDPKLKQYGGGPGRGIFQFEGDSLKTTYKRAKNFFKNGNSPFKESKDYDASTHSVDDQKALALIDLNARPNFNIDKAIESNEALTEQWGKGWQTTSDPDKMRNFSIDAETYDTKIQKENINQSKEIIPTEVSDMWNKKFKNGTKEVSKKKYTPYQLRSNKELKDSLMNNTDPISPAYIRDQAVRGYERIKELDNKSSKYKNGVQSLKRYQYGSQNLSPNVGYQVLEVPQAGGIGNVMGQSAQGAALGSQIAGPWGAVGGAALGVGKGMLENINTAGQIGDITAHNLSLENQKTDPVQRQALLAEDGMVLNGSRKYQFGAQAISAIPQALDFFGAPQEITQPLGSVMGSIMEGMDGGQGMGSPINPGAAAQVGQMPMDMSSIAGQVGGAVPMMEQGSPNVGGSDEHKVELERDELVLDKNFNLIGDTGNSSKSHDGGGIEYSVVSKGDLALGEKKNGFKSNVIEEGSVIIPSKLKEKVKKHIANNDKASIATIISNDIPTEREAAEKQQQETVMANDGLKDIDYGGNAEFEKYGVNLANPDFDASAWAADPRNKGYQDYLHNKTDYDTKFGSKKSKVNRGTGITGDDVLGYRKGYRESLNIPQMPGRPAPRASAPRPTELATRPFVNVDESLTSSAPDDVVVPAATPQGKFSYDAPQANQYRGDKFAAGLPSMYNLGQGMFGNVEKSARRFFDPQAQKYTDLSPQQKAEALGRQRLMQKNISNAHMSRGQELGSLAQAQQRYAGDVGRINQGEAQRFDRIQQANTNLFNQAGQMNLGLANQYDDIDARNRAAKQAMTAKGLEGQSKLAQFNRQEKYQRDLDATKDLREQQKLAIMGKDQFDSPEEMRQFYDQLGIGSTYQGGKGSNQLRHPNRARDAKAIAKKAVVGGAKAIGSGAKAATKLVASGFDKAKELRGTKESRAADRDKILKTAKENQKKGFSPTGKGKRLIDRNDKRKQMDIKNAEFDKQMEEYRKKKKNKKENKKFREFNKNNPPYGYDFI